MIRATLYTDIGETYRLLHPDGYRGGKPLTALMTTLAALHSPHLASDVDDDDILGWYSQLESESGVSLVDVSEELVQGIFFGDLTANDYLFLLSFCPDSEQVAEWQNRYEELKDTWVSVTDLLEHVRVIRRLLAETNLEELVWLDIADTVVDLDALIETLELAIQRKAERVTIQMH